ncbi:type II toxin-antitoxin system RelE/ParE family toxin [Holdemanella porci]|uniref:type II toxin-antitoxin system RelE/ParE family toxin n=1 Tax=Holdemanella porci TaxID=2652276 RepID=UPI001E5BFF83|nr:type II toxin-antitoxin system RelE/ParE family toxin [Holdemanella porci]
MKAKVPRTIDLLENNGPFLREPYSKYLEDEIFELRIKQENNITRVLYFFFISNRAILINGFIKKTQKTPKNVIETAKKYREDYQRRNQND